MAGTEDSILLSSGGAVYGQRLPHTFGGRFSWAGQRYVERSVRLSTLTDVMLSGNEGVITKGCQIFVPYYDKQVPWHENLPTAAVPAEPVRWLPVALWLLVMFPANFFSFLVDELARLAVWLTVRQQRIPLLVPADRGQLKPFMYDWLTLLGGFEVIPYDVRPHFMGPARVAEPRFLVHQLHMVDWQDAPGTSRREDVFLLPPRWALQRLRDLATWRVFGSSPAPAAPGGGKKLLWIQRAVATTRRVANEAELLHAMMGLLGDGWVLQIFSDSPLPSARETMELFHSADIVVGVHGSGQANVVFCRPGTGIIDINLPEPHSQYTAHNSYALGFHYRLVMLQGVGLHQSLNITLPVRDVLDVLRACMFNLQMLKLWLATWAITLADELDLLSEDAPKSAIFHSASSVASAAKPKFASMSMVCEMAKKYPGHSSEPGTECATPAACPQCNGVWCDGAVKSLLQTQAQNETDAYPLQNDNETAKTWPMTDAASGFCAYPSERSDPMLGSDKLGAAPTDPEEILKVCEMAEKYEGHRAVPGTECASPSTCGGCNGVWCNGTVKSLLQTQAQNETDAYPLQNDNETAKTWPMTDAASGFCAYPSERSDPMLGSDKLGAAPTDPEEILKVCEMAEKYEGHRAVPGTECASPSTCGGCNGVWCNGTVKSLLQTQAQNETDAYPLQNDNETAKTWPMTDAASGFCAYPSERSDPMLGSDKLGAAPTDPEEILKVCEMAEKYEGHRAVPGTECASPSTCGGCNGVWCNGTVKSLLQTQAQNETDAYPLQNDNETAKTWPMTDAASGFCAYPSERSDPMLGSDKLGAAPTDPEEI
ncbi:unnamed protein product [Symbiodinium sp. CCMP2592]|nr:unnamed protein product [Symbiodinium sp. CCMP2592]